MNVVLALVVPLKRPSLGLRTGEPVLLYAILKPALSALASPSALKPQDNMVKGRVIVS